MSVSPRIGSFVGDGYVHVDVSMDYKEATKATNNNRNHHNSNNNNMRMFPILTITL